MEDGNNRKPTSSNSKETIATLFKPRPSVVITEVEEFLKRYRSGEEVLTSKAEILETTFTTTKKNWLGREVKVQDTKAYCSALGYEIAIYLATKDAHPSGVWEEAYNLLDLIERARAFGALLNAKQQAFHYEQEIERLKEQVDNLRKLNKDLATENKRLGNLLPDEIKKGKNNGLGDTEVGDVGF